MRRWLLVGVGVAVGVVVIRRVMTVPAVQEVRKSSMADVRGFVAAVKDGMAQRESELRSALGLDLGAAATAPTDSARSVLDDPTGPRAR